MTNATEVLDRARRIADEVLFPAALATDAADAVPLSHLDLLAREGFYGLAGPEEAGGLGIDLATGCKVIEIFAGACLATAFVWIQHQGPVFVLSNSESPALREEWLEPLCRGRRRAGIALGGARPGPPLLSARRASGGWILDGTAPWVTGWGRIDVMHVAARTGNDLVWLLVDARPADTLSVERPRLVAVDASATVTLVFQEHFVPEERVTGIEPHEAWLARDPFGLRLNASLALGVAGRCCRMIGPSPLDHELSACRTALDEGPPEAMPGARAAVAELAMRAAMYLVVAHGSRSVLLGEHPQRLAREAMFLLVFGSRPPIRTALLERIGG